MQFTKKLPGISRPRTLPCGIRCRIIEANDMDAADVDHVGDYSEIHRTATGRYPNGTGWYTDEFMDETATGNVYGYGRKQVFDGYGERDWNGEYYGYLAVVHYLDTRYVDTDTYSEAIDAAHVAHSMAERIAELERNCHEIDVKAYSLHIRLKEAHGQIRQAIEIVREHGGMDSLPSATAATVRTLWDSAQDDRAAVWREIREYRPVLFKPCGHTKARMAEQECFMDSWRAGWDCAA